jgi:hypothetical protein
MSRTRVLIASLVLFDIVAASPGLRTPVAGSVGAALAAEQPGAADEPKTLKERLSDKASDEQRVDNCMVPLKRRGMTPRPDCPRHPDAKLTLGPVLGARLDGAPIRPYHRSAISRSSV